MSSWVLTAEEYLRPFVRRWSRVTAVGVLADRVAPAFGADAETLVAGAFLHDIGYPPALALTGACSPFLQTPDRDA